MARNYDDCIKEGQGYPTPALVRFTLVPSGYRRHQRLLSLLVPTGFAPIPAEILRTVSAKRKSRTDSGFPAVLAGSVARKHAETPEESPVAVRSRRSLCTSPVLAFVQRSAGRSEVLGVLARRSLVCRFESALALLVTAFSASFGCCLSRGHYGRDVRAKGKNKAIEEKTLW